jgi:thiol-disulfide isomerase/thioredoxin
MISFKRGAILFLGGLLASASVAMAQDRPADKILADINAVEMPKIPENRGDQKAIQDYIVKSQKAMEQKATLIGELYKAAPDNPELAKLLPQRWQARMQNPETMAEIDEVIAKSKNEKLVTEAAFSKVVMAFRKAGRNADADTLTPVADEFLKRFPKDERGAMILSSLASITKDEAKKEALAKRLEKGYPDSPAVKAMAGERRLRDAVGKPFEISFEEALKGSQISSQTLKGKVVVIDFWATWCGPCVAEMPNMKKLYAEYKDKGVEFVGVSLDAPKAEGGYDKLKEYVEKNKIEWPQYYQGNGWESNFSASWGINSIPRVFLVDADGKLATTDARGKLETLIPEYLEKAKKAKDEVKP